ncbi:hypothetical protein [Albidovulum sp.]|uniref:COG3904 family protein n=1 Tax=Albidovulum sp. TaxID=1872424 RepID=UPI0039B8BC84
MRTLILSILLALPAAGKCAGEERASLASKFRAEGTVLVYDTEHVGEDGEITPDDIDGLRAALRENPGVAKLRLNSAGGSIWAAEDMSRIVTDFDLDTEVDGECSSSCVTVFLGGKARSMTRGSRLGLHSRWWAAEDVQNYYERNKIEERWDTPFEFGAWIYEDTQAEVYEAISFVVSRGVDPAFAIEMHAPRDSMWYPDRADLEKAGVLRP